MNTSSDPHAGQENRRWGNLGPYILNTSELLGTSVLVLIADTWITWGFTQVVTVYVIKI
jgi:hypothetical protein